MGHFFQFLLASHFDLPGSQFIFGTLRILPWIPMHLFAKMGFYCKGIWVEHSLTILPFGLQGAFLHMCGRGGLLTLRTRDMWSEQGPASSLNCPAILVLEFWSIGNELLYPGRVGSICLLPQAESEMGFCIPWTSSTLFF